MFFGIFVFLIFFFFLFFFFFFFFSKFYLVFSFLNWKFFNFFFFFSFMEGLFFFILIFVVLSIFFFTSFYMTSEVNFFFFFFVFLVFIFSMIFLNFSKGIFSLVLFWDLLGISSYFLVLYYNNWDSNVGSMNVALTNRLGDFLLFCLFFFFLFYFFNFKGVVFFGLFFFFFFFSGFTKSAQFPFSSWLPKAMSAPTPVSALVHSSTLVTAGLVLLMNFFFFFVNGVVLSIIVFVGCLTMFFSSIMSLLEQDLKKVVALSTLSQMGLSTVILGFSLVFFCLFHLVSHALFKCCLFMQVGYFIFCFFGQQDGRFYCFNFNSANFVQFQLLITLFCLCGLFFLGGMVSKDFLLEFGYFLSFGFFFFFFFFFFF